ncbi:MAG: Type 4 prepilin-like proteins leader peptide-processing enzyme [Gemmatimonadaceae bacterium]|nr:Type 4 prepilin-like proteins leader peptide-processing enzyme [Gemmatimonadaceae bacterium]
MTDTVLGVYAFVVGACVGSFLNVCVARWPLDLSVVRPRSRCPRCGTGIAWYDNVPIASWLILRGKCRRCALPISGQYPLVELLVASGWLAAVMRFGPTAEALRVAVFGTTLFGIALTDAKHYLIPDGFTVFGIVWTLATAVIFTLLGETSAFASPYDAMVGACVGAGAISIVGWLGEVMLKREAMGFGDVTLMAVVGAALGTPRTLLTIFLGALLGAIGFIAIVYPVVRWRRRLGDQLELIETGVREPMPQVPFGVFLAPAALAALLWGQPLIDWYLRSVLLVP